MSVFRKMAVVTTAALLPCLLVCQETLPKKSGTGSSQTPKHQELAAAAVDKFLKGLRLADLPEGKAMMGQSQWVVGVADYGANFYSRPEYTNIKTLFEGMFDTDVPGVQGYKRLMELDAVSKAKTTIKVRFLATAYEDKISGEWKVLDTTDESVDVERNVAFFEQHLSDTKYTSEQENYLTYGHWLLTAGRIKEAKVALLKAREAKLFSEDDPDGSRGGKYLSLHKAQIEALLSVISHVVGE